MTTYDDLMPACQNGCPYWEIACCIDNKLGLCSMCELEMRKQKQIEDYGFGSIVVDSETNVEYWMSKGTYNWGTLTMLVDKSGSPKVRK